MAIEDLIPFGPFTYDPNLHLLFRGNERIRLRPKSMGILAAVLANQERILTYDEMIRVVWGEDSLATYNDVQKAAIHVINALKDKDHAYLENIRGVGYRFVREGYPSNEAEPLTQNVNGSLASETTKSSDGEPTRFRLDITSEPKLLEERLPTKLLKLYYPDSDLRAQNLFRYSYSVNGDEITTNIVTSASWLELAMPINERAFRSFPLQEPIVSWPSISESESERLKAELRGKDIQFHNKPIYCLQSFTPQDRKTIATFSLAQYIDYKLKLGRLEEELTQALISSGFVPKTAYSKWQSLMPLRNELLPDSKKMADYGRRLCAGGTNVLLFVLAP